MIRFADLSIRHKLISILMLTSVAGLLVIGLAFVTNDLFGFYDDERQDLAAITQVIGKNSAASLAFGDSEAAGEILRALKEKPQVLQACLFTADGRLFARYDRSGTPEPCAASASDGSRLTRSGVLYSSGIALKGERIGSIYLASDFSELRQRLTRYGVIVLSVMVGSMLVAFMLGLRLQRVISGPILQLAQTARRVSSERNYSLRAEGAGGDELGFLISRFNQMLAEIEHRDVELQQHRQWLESEVAARTQAELEIRKSRDLLKTFVEHAPVALAMLDRDLRCVQASIRWCRDYSVDKAAILGRRYSELFPNFPEHWQKAFGRGLAGEVVSYDEDCLVGLDGNTHWLRWEVRPWQNSGLETEGIIFFSEDITERKEAEKERTKLLTILEQSPDFIGLAELDGTVAYLNPAGRRLIGLDRLDDLRKTNIADLQWPEDRNISEQFDRAGRHGHKCEGEQRLRHVKTGEPIPVDKSNFGLFDPKGSLIGTAVVSRDIRKRKELETRLSTTAEQLRAVLQSTQNIVIALDHQWHITYANRLPWGADASNAVGRNLWEIYPQFLDTAFEQEFRRALEDGAPVQFEEYCATVQAWFATTAYPTNSGLLVFFRDVTEKRSLEEQIRHAQKLEAIGQLAAGIAHEINTPVQYVGDNTNFLRDSWVSLAEILSISRKLRDEAANGAVSPNTIATFDACVETADVDYLAKEIPRAIDQSRDGVQRVAKIVRAMKEFSHPGSEEKHAVDINKAIETTLTVAHNEWKYVADIHTCFDPMLPLVPCYAGEFNQVILNLLVNAAHAIADVVGDGARGKGTITITTKQVANAVEIAIQDTGTGILKEIQPRVFDPFFTTKEVGKGAGQGLALAHSIVVKKHGGKIWFESEWQQGTTFFLRLPLAAVPEDVQR